MFSKGLSIWLAVAAGGAIGACARYGVYRLLGTTSGFPWTTLLVNIVGSGMMGALIVWLARHEPQPELVRAFATVGVLGAFTTFSTFSLDAYFLYEKKAYLAAGGYISASVILSITAFVAGLSLMRALS